MITVAGILILYEPTKYLYFIHLILKQIVGFELENAGDSAANKTGNRYLLELTFE